MLAELAERLDVQKLVDIAPFVRLRDVQRLGYLLDTVGQGKVAESLAEWLGIQRPRAVLLHPGEEARGEPDGRWHVVPNVELEVDE